MAKAKAKQNPSAAAETETSVSAPERIARALALHLVKGAGTGEAVATLDAIGFSTTDIARLLDITTNNVSVTRFKNRNAAKKKAKAE